jgi:hypothetical protein
MTAFKLVEALKLAGCSVTTVGQELEIEGSIPPKLEAYLRIIHPLVRATLAGQRAWAFSRDGKPSLGPRPTDPPRSRFWAGALDLCEKLPHATGTIAVEDDVEWHRISPFDALDYPELFDPPIELVKPIKKSKPQVAAFGGTL